MLYFTAASKEQSCLIDEILNRVGRKLCIIFFFIKSSLSGIYSRIYSYSIIMSMFLRIDDLVLPEYISTMRESNKNTRTITQQN